MSVKLQDSGATSGVLPDAGRAATRTRPELIATCVWLVSVAMAVGLFALATASLYNERSAPPDAVVPGLAALGLSGHVYAAYYSLVQVAFALVCLAVAGAIVRRRADDRMALFVALLLVLLATTNYPNMRALEARYPAFAVAAKLGVFFAYGALILFLFLFPDGRFVPSSMRAPTGICLAASLVAWLLPGSSLAAPSDWAALTIMLGVGAGVAAQAYRYLHVSGPAQRQQTKWIVFGTATMGSISFALLLAGVLFPSLTRPGVVSLAWDLIKFTGVTFAFLLVPLTIGIAILRYRLWDIDILINRALVYTGLSLSIAGIYALLVGSMSALFHSPRNPAISFVAAAVVAILFQPLRDRLQQTANRLIYGERDDPYAVLSRLSKRIEATLAPDAVLPALVQTVGEALKLPYVALALRQNNTFEVIAAHGSPVPNPVVVPLVYQTEPVGQLMLAPRARGETFSAADRRLIEDLAREASAAAHAVHLHAQALRLAAELQRARERLVTAREEERRRLRRDLHDGLGPQLATHSLKIEAARELLESDPRRADQLLQGLLQQSQTAIADIRRLVYDLRPPALDELGLAGAIREQAGHYPHSSLRVMIDVPEPLPALPAAVEVAAYRIIQEALTNVVKHAQARTCTISLHIGDGAMEIEIVDDGQGLSAHHGIGVGLHSMRERAEELGGSCAIMAGVNGGTVVHARLPRTDD